MRGRGFLAIRLLVWLLAASPAAPAQALPTATAGHVTLPQVPQQPVALRGEWGFAWHRYLDPAWQALPTQAFAPVPSNWNDLHADCPSGQSLAVEAMGERTASRLFVNGTLVAQHGELGTSAADTHAAIYI